MGAHADIPTGAAAKALPLCDLVMKGGVTSGLVYPKLVTKLATRYRFASVGGSSAGAIAAALCAAAEYGRQADNGGGMDKLDVAVEDLGREGLLRGLFQPARETRPLFELIQGVFLVKARLRTRLLTAARMAYARQEPIAAIAVVLVAALVLLAAAAFAALPIGVALVLALVVALLLVPLVLVATALVAAGLLVFNTEKALGDLGYGLCPGTAQEGTDEIALIDWLHARLQDCAGRTTTDPPLTFRDLDTYGVRLMMLTTDLSLARPVRVPEGIRGYLFCEAELRGRLPEAVVSAMAKAARTTDSDYLEVPTDDLPVLVGVRLSLSFPVLLSTMPLHWRPEGSSEKPARHLFSDGGIGSNFPVALFDTWFPGRPTFAIDLARYPDDSHDDVFMLTDPAEPAVPRWRPVDSLFAFLADIKDTMQNWRDTLQSELPGFRDRVCQIRFTEGEGGLHLNMDPEMVRKLVLRGEQAGALILKVFDEGQWEQHQWVRYLTLMSQVQESLHRAGAPFAEFAPGLSAGLPDVAFYRDGRDAAWCERARLGTTALLTLADGWGPPPLGIDFVGVDPPLPEPVMRVVPKA